MEFPTITECADLDYVYDGYFENSHYVYDPCINSNGACFREPYIREREYKDEDITYVCPTLEEMKKILIPYWENAKMNKCKYIAKNKKLIENLKNETDIHKFIKTIIAIKQ